MAERSKAHAWRACSPRGVEGSNPSPSATVPVLSRVENGREMAVQLKVKAPATWIRIGMGSRSAARRCCRAARCRRCSSAVVFLDEGRDKFRCQHPLTQPVEDASLEQRRCHGARVAASALLAGRLTAVAIAPGDGDLTAAGATDNQAAKEALRPPVPFGAPSGDRRQTVLNTLPQFLVDDRQLRYRGLDPFSDVFQSGPAGAGVGVACETVAVEHLTAGIQRIDEQATPRPRCPWMVEGFHWPPRGAGMPSALRPLAIATLERPAANSVKIRTGGIYRR